MRHIAKALLQLQRPVRMRHFVALQPIERLDPAAIRNLSNNALTSMLRHAAGKVPFYRDHCAKAGLDPASVTHADLAAFPRVDKTLLTEGGARFQDETAARSAFVESSTGGSSGVWFRFYLDARVVELRTASDLRARTWAGWQPGDKQALLWGHAGDNRRSARLASRVAAIAVHRVKTLDAYRMDDAVLARYYRDLRAYRPRLLIGYASALAFFADYLHRHDLPFPAPAGIISAAETLTDEHRASIERRFPCPVLNRYGSRELGVVAQQCPEQRGLHILVDRVHLEILRPGGTACAPGEAGEVVATDLDNRVMPLIRYRTGDIAVADPIACPCGRGYPLLGRIEGRTSEILVGAQGRYVWGSPLRFRNGIQGIAKMQIVQERLGQVTVRIVPDAAWGESSRARLIARVRELLGEIDVTISLETEILPAPSGKYQFAVSKVSPFRA